MKAILTAKQHRLLRFIDERIRTEGVAPSYEEMSQAIGLSSKSGTHRLIKALEERGFIRRIPHRMRALEVVKLPGSKPAIVEDPANDVLISLPLLGRIAAGYPIEAVAGIAHVDVPRAMLGVGEHYVLEVTGDSMVDAGILDGDHVIIRHSSQAREGAIVVAMIDGNEATLKYFRREGSMIRLDPANRSYDPQRYVSSRVEIKGCLAGLIRSYH